MKKLIIILLLVVFFFFESATTINADDEKSEFASSVNAMLISGTRTLNDDYEIDFIYTYYDTPVMVYHILEDLSQAEKNDLNDFTDTYYPSATRIYTATALFNCHSYAWYNSDVTTNDYWIDDPSAFYTDGSYDEVFTPQVGDIICYFDDKGTPNNYSDDENLHSGIVISFDSSITSNNICGNANQVIVESKWGPCGVFQHSGDYCPYTSLFYGNADYVRYYRHSHSFTDAYSFYSYTQHQSFCCCGEYELDPHVCRSGDSYFIGGHIYSICIYCLRIIDISTYPVVIESINNYPHTENGSIILPNGIIVLADEDVSAYMNGTLVFFISGDTI